MSSNAGGPRRSADAEKDLAALNKELAWELSKAAVDAAGIIDPTPISDGIGAAMSLADGDLVGAGLSLVSMVPYLGDALGKSAKAARAAAKLNKLRKQIAAATAEIEALKKAEKAADAAKRAKGSTKGTPRKKSEPCVGCPPKKVGAKRGPKPKGTGPHNQKIEQRIEKLKKDLGPDWEHVGGGSMKEEFIPTPGGSKSARRPDITFRNSKTGEYYRENIGRTYKDGGAVKREIDALNDIENATGRRPEFTPYDK